jgi:hypothetical protein
LTPEGERERVCVCVGERKKDSVEREREREREIVNLYVCCLTSFSSFGTNSLQRWEWRFGAWL